MPGTLYVVATPIGNLEDVTLRALRVLREVSLIAAEDTRRTARLLQHYSISTPATSLHEHNESARTPGLVDRLRGGESIALVSDAGTPLISDPGSRLVSAAHAAGIRVEPVPGPNAAVALLSATGFGGDGFVFVGFPPARSKSRKDWLRSLAQESRPIVMYEAPHRIHETLREILDILGNRPLAIGRELTKAHEELAIRPISHWVQAPPRALGEFVLVVGPWDSGQPEAAGLSDESLVEMFGQLTNSGVMGRREALRQVAKRHGVPARRVFNAVEKHKNSGE